jgi:hypothetical protein
MLVAGTYTAKYRDGQGVVREIAAMRHSDVNLTMNTYTDPKLLEVAAALESLPAFPLGPRVDRQDVQQPEVAATTADYRQELALAPTLATTAVQSGQVGTLADCGVISTRKSLGGDDLAVDAFVGNDLRPLSILDNGRQEKRAKGFEPSTSSLGS